MKVLSVDIGTTTISAVVLDTENGCLLESCTLPNDSAIPSANPQEKMQDPKRIEEKVKQITDRFCDADAIGFTGQMHGVVYVDAEGNAVSPLYTWQDGRAAGMCADINEKTGYSVSAGYGLATHAFLCRQGQLPSSAVKLCTIMEYCISRLCGCKPVMHSSNAASLGFFREGFDEDALKRVGADPSFLPAVTDECEMVGRYRGIPVAVAIGDNQAGFLGSVREPSQMSLANFGTGSQISLLAQGRCQTDEEIELRPLMKGQKLLSGSALCGGRAYAIMERFFRLYAGGDQYDRMNELALQGLKAPLTVRTTFCGTRQNPERLGSIESISEDNWTPEALIAGTLMGMAQELHSLFERMPHAQVRRLAASGNAVRKNPALQRALEEVFGCEVLIPVHQEEAAFGAALFAAAASGTETLETLMQRCIRYQQLS